MRTRLFSPHSTKAVGPMPRGRRWLCAFVLGITAPVWMSGLLVVALACAIWGLITQLTPED